ncbi:small capsid protein [macacine betaherpesvirus 9]|uniref:Small capsomere-interacting protein n=1 Tax=macacine betaherpesvirus 9 TaxID=2560568 RepID=A0A191S3W4_9BETA|nr:small capsid protein [macacine betaherpesvirus 9]ANC96590.1 small capsid protein [macacine betaherpesvirus 9]
MTTNRGDEITTQINQISGNSSKKEEEKKKQQMFATILGLQPSMSSHPVTSTFLSRYVKQNTGNIDKSAFRIDFLRMLALHRLNSKIDE